MTGKRNNATLALHMQKTLVLKATSVEDLALISGLSVTATRRWVNAMHEAKAAHIEDYGPDVRGRLFVPLWRWGKKPDAARPGPQRTSTDRMRDHRARKAAACTDAPTAGRGEQRGRA